MDAGVSVQPDAKTSVTAGVGDAQVDTDQITDTVTHTVCELLC